MQIEHREIPLSLRRHHYLHSTKIQEYEDYYLCRPLVNLQAQALVYSTENYIIQLSSQSNCFIKKMYFDVVP